ncbi:hypothetical protein [Halovivax cerinus]|uniref:Uncharacterized protein n=1 Tax=Halovivax cerinus TaxID=1487865 RepID=A0ABD5NM95_9EURY|nr:hypothetical protein [Halovivax cerinus]
MTTRAHRALVFTLYQLTILFGILLMPFALLTRQVGVSVPIRRLIVRAESAYENTKP